MSLDLKVQVVGDRVSVLQGRKLLVDAPLEAVVQEIARASERRPSLGILPRGVRSWRERGNATALALELPPQARTVRWIAKDSKRPFGPRTKYREALLGFPFIVLLLVFRDGAPTGLQQLYYRNAPLDAGDELRLPNMYNVADAYGQKCWLCLQHLGPGLGAMDWPKKLNAVVTHLWSAAFNRSAEEHEGNSYGSSMKGIDPRVETIEAWEAATRESPYFALDVPWVRARRRAATELERMLDRVVAAPRLQTASELSGLVTRARARAPAP